MKIAKGHYVPKELITSEAVHEAVVKCFVAAGFKDCRPMYGNFKRMESFAGLSVDNQGEISWGDKGSSAKEPLTLQQLFTAENGLQWPDWAESIIGGDRFVYFKGNGHLQTISGDFKSLPFGGDVLATRQPKDKEVKTIEDAVIELDGKWDSQSQELNYLHYCSTIGFFSSPIDSSEAKYPTICSRSEFESAAKRLGYINGYRYGVEYPTNGKQPELLDDLLIQGRYDFLQNEWGEDNQVAGEAAWHHITAFKITDQRYKPADTSYLNALSKDQSLTHSEEGLTHSEWWDYENSKAIKLPHAGVEVIGFIGSNFKEFKCHFVGLNSRGSLVIEKEDGELKQYHKHQINLKPLDHATRKAELEREKVIEAAVKIYDDKKCFSAESFASELHKAGMLVLPPKKSDTED